ncbi:DNA polymerase epsilon catalytic subunit [Nowakowskiella sp. JEL0078]|nr:DNA polymerase epsilon catalytic subunit [Nowakowskiella sp. JEL0078]
MAGIVCLTGATTIQLARTRIDQIGRPLELDTDGIWCILPKSFPEQFVFNLKNGKQYHISYPCVMLNHLVHDKFTNHQYHEMKETNDGVAEYEVRSENSIFFEVDGPYRAMILPSSTEEDKLLKKRYAVFNHDGSLAELKGFEVKRRGELKLVKIFQSEIFSKFLDGTTLDECYASVAHLADTWLDVLYSKGADLTDPELIDLISENRSMSKSLAEYGSQKSTSISTAKRLAEFLGDQMVKDKGLNCKFIISSRPPDLPVSERAIPVAIFQDAVEPQVKKHFLRKWLKDSSLTTFDIRGIIDWNYYLDRFGSVIQKVITIPAAMQKVANPVPRVRHPDWLLKKLASRDDKLKQRRITDSFKPVAEIQNLIVEGQVNFENSLAVNEENPASESDNDNQKGDHDIEDFGISSTGKHTLMKGRVIPVVHKHSKMRTVEEIIYDEEENTEPPPVTGDYRTWLKFQKRKWAKRRADVQAERDLYGEDHQRSRRKVLEGRSNVESFFRMKTDSIITKTWEVLQIAATDVLGEFRVWAIVDEQLHKITLHVPRIFYVNSRVANPVGIVTAAEVAAVNDPMGRPQLSVIKRMRTLPRSHPLMHLYECTMSEKFYVDNNAVFSNLFNHPEIEGVYETKTPLLFRAITHLGCLLEVNRQRRAVGPRLDDGFHLFDLNKVDSHSGGTQHPYLSQERIQKLNSIFVYHSSNGNNTCQVFGVFFSIRTGSNIMNSLSTVAKIFVVDPGRNRAQIPNLKKMFDDFAHLFCTEEEGLQSQLVTSSKSRGANRGGQKSRNTSGNDIFKCHRNIDFDISAHSTENQVLAEINKCLREYQQEQRGPTILLLQSPRTPRQLIHGSGTVTNAGMTAIRDFPYISVPAHKQDRAFPAIGWQTPAFRRMFSHLGNLNMWLQDQIVLSRYADVPLCNVEQDYLAFMADVFLARRLFKSDMILWTSLNGVPDLGGHEEDDHNLELDELMDPEINVPGTYASVCIEIDIHELAQNSIVMSHLVNEMEGSLTGVGFEKVPQLLDQHINPESQADSISKNILQNVADTNQFSPNTFNVIRSLIKTWETEASHNKNRIAGLLLGHLHRWITGGGGTSASSSTTSAATYDGANSTASITASRFFDPALRDLVHSIMRKVFLQLLGEFRRLGSTIVHARFDKLIIATTKNNAQTAKSYTEFVLQTIRKNPVFALLDLQMKTVYEIVVWMDYYNLGGLVRNEETEENENEKDIPLSVSIVEDEENSIDEVEETFSDGGAPKKLLRKKKIEDSDGEDEDENNPPEKDISHSKKNLLTIISEWNIGDYLPVILQNEFQNMIYEYLSKLTTIVGIGRQGKGNLTKGRSNGVELSKILIDDTATALQMYIASDFKRLMLEKVENIVYEHEQSRIKDHKSPLWAFPLQPGSHMDPPPSNNPALEFIKSVCAVLGLEVRKAGGLVTAGSGGAVLGAGGSANGADGYMRQVQMLKRDLLNLIGVREFAPEARFINPCHAFRLPLVVCEYCHVVRELDLTRDPMLVVTNDDNSENRPWECLDCKYQHDKSDIEQRLIDILQQRLVAWQLQDLQCRKCRQVKAENLSLMCHVCFSSESSEASAMNRRKNISTKEREGRAPAGFTTVIPLTGQKRLLRVFKNIAEVHQMYFLLDMVGWVLSMM